jgi:hypothetical protein
MAQTWSPAVSSADSSDMGGSEQRTWLVVSRRIASGPGCESWIGVLLLVETARKHHVWMVSAVCHCYVASLVGGAVAGEIII